MKKYYKRETGSTVILLKPSGKILLQLRDDGEGRKISYPNRWCIPGGGKRGNENYVNTAVREMKEEFDIDINGSKCKLLMIYSYWKYKNYHIFVCDVNENSRPRLQEGDGLRWVTLKQLKKINLPAIECKIIPRFEKYLKEKTKPIKSKNL